MEEWRVWNNSKYEVSSFGHVRKKLSRSEIKLKFLIYEKKKLNSWEYISQLVAETFVILKINQLFFTLKITS